MVYIKEAHPEDGWVLVENRDKGIEIKDPSSNGKRREIAQTCAVRLGTRIPVAVDNLDNRVASAYGGWPDRLYLIGSDGIVLFQSEPGPFGFEPEQLREAIVDELRR